MRSVCKQFQLLLYCENSPLPSGEFSSLTSVRQYYRETWVEKTAHRETISSDTDDIRLTTPWFLIPISKYGYT